MVSRLCIFKMSYQRFFKHRPDRSSNRSSPDFLHLYAEQDNFIILCQMLIESRFNDLKKNEKMNTPKGVH